MTSSPHVVSRTSILILSYVLFAAGMLHRLPHTVAFHCVMGGTMGLVSYVGLKWTQFLRNRATVCRLLTDYGRALSRTRAQSR